MTNVESSGGPDVVITVGGADFAAWLSREGVRRLDLPTCPQLRRRKEKGGHEINIIHGGDADEEDLERLAAFLEQYLEGREPSVRPPVDLSGLSPFTRRVLEVTALIPFGETRSYGFVAEKAGAPGAGRAAGGALGRNPVPLLVPCHRVIRSDGSLGGFGCGIGTKELLLEIECAPTERSANEG